jgi:hypothetical protein
MNFLIEIDQIRSIRAGYDAPHSTRVIDIDASKIPDAIREVLMENYNLVQKKALIGDKPVKIILPLTEDKVPDAMKQIYGERLEQLKTDPGGAG